LSEANLAALDQLFFNLVQNAHKHGKASRVEFSWVLQEGELVFDIQDNGHRPLSLGDAPSLEQFVGARQNGTGGRHGNGLRMCLDFARERRGSFEHVPSESGTHFRLRFPFLGEARVQVREAARGAAEGVLSA
jgi:K+-sensing histidine kinase KdpD